jgi:bacterial/archaeal transporter family protein
MTWLPLALLTAVLWAGWSFLGKIGLKSATPIQGTIMFGLASVVVGALSVALGLRATSWSPASIWVTALSATLGGVGLVTFYLALDRGKASLVAPVIGVYPAVVALLSVAFLSDRLSALQAVGVALAVAGVVLVGAGG